MGRLARKQCMWQRGRHHGLHYASVTGQSHFLITLHVSRPQGRRMHLQFSASAKLLISQVYHFTSGWLHSIQTCSTSQIRDTKHVQSKNHDEQWLTRVWIVPEGAVGQTCKPKTAETPCMAPSSTITLAPAPPSSAGWNSSFTVPCSSASCAFKYLAAAWMLHSVIVMMTVQLLQ